MSQELSTQPTEVSDVELARTAKIAKVVKGLAGGMTVERACKAAGVDRRTWSRWKNKGLLGCVYRHVE